MSSSRRPRRRRHRRHDGRRLLLRLHPHLRRRRRSHRPTSRTTTRCSRLRKPPRARRSALGSLRRLSTPPPATSSAAPGTATSSCTAPATASGWRSTRSPTSSPATTSRSSPAWRSASSRASTCRAATAPASRTSSSSPTTAPSRSTRAARPRRVGGLTGWPSSGSCRPRRHASSSHSPVRSPRTSWHRGLPSMRRRQRFPREVFRTLGKAGLLGLPYPEEYGGGGQPYEVYLQVLEELAAAWAAVALGVSVHTLSCFPVAAFGTDEQKKRWLPGHARRRPARCLLPVRAAGRVRRGGAGPRAPARRRRLRPQRHQGLGHPRRCGRLLQRVLPYVGRGVARHLRPARACRHARSRPTAPREEDGAAFLADDPDHSGRRARVRRPADRRGGRGASGSR